jgi:hypothetical protein
MVRPGIVAFGRNGDGLIMRRVIAIAVAAASLGWLLLDAFALLGRLQADATRHSGPARVHPAGGGCQDLGGTFLQDPLFGERARAGRRFFGDLHSEQVPNGNYSCADYPQSRRFLDDHRSQSGVRGTAASRSAAEGFRQTRAQAKEAEAA